MVYANLANVHTLHVNTQAYIYRYIASKHLIRRYNINVFSSLSHVHKSHIVDTSKIV